MTVSSIFDKIGVNSAKNPEMATSLDAIFAFRITGDDGGEWTLRLLEGTEKGFVETGLAEDANVVVTMKSKVWLDIFNDKTNPMKAFMMGRIKVKGDMGLAMKIQNIISLGK